MRHISLFTKITVQLFYHGIANMRVFYNGRVCFITIKPFNKRARYFTLLTDDEITLIINSINDIMRNSEG